MQQTIPPPSARELAAPWRCTALAAALAAGCGSASAFQVDTGIEGASLNWETTLKYSNAIRTENRRPSLVVNPNVDDGNRNFDRGLVSNRFDLLTELTGKYRSFGARLSGAGWYDQAYNRRSDNDSPATLNSLPSNLTGDGFSKTTRRLHGRNAEVLDAFVSMDLDVGGRTGVVRVGQHAQVWGESLFYGPNAIAGAMTPSDVIKLASVPGTQFKEALLPVPQVSGQFQVGERSSISAYYQLRWRKTRLPAVGSFFNANDTFFPGGDLIQSTLPGDPTYTVVGPPVLRGPDVAPPNSGQGGLAFRTMAGDTDLGFYWVRFHEKTPQPVISLGAVPTPIGVQVLPVGYNMVYQRNINAFAVSASRSVGEWNLAAEGGIRTNQPLAGSGGTVLPNGTFDNKDNPAQAVGRTAHLNVSALGSLGPSSLWRDASLTAELAWNRVLSIKRNPQAVDPNATRDAWAGTLVFQPTYYQVVSGVDLNVPIVVNYVPKGSRSAFFGPSQVSGGGTISIGLDARVVDTWRLTANYSHYYGGPRAGADEFGRLTYGQTLADRDFVSFSVSRAF